MDISFSFPDWPEIPAWTPMLLMELNRRLVFDDVDYLPKVMFNQTKWNDDLNQKN
jgi:hypothetical protein